MLGPQRQRLRLQSGSCRALLPLDAGLGATAVVRWMELGAVNAYQNVTAPLGAGGMGPSCTSALRLRRGPHGCVRSRVSVCTGTRQDRQTPSLRAAGCAL